MVNDMQLGVRAPRQGCSECRNGPALKLENTTMATLPDLSAIVKQNEALMAELAALKSKIESRDVVSVKVNALGTKNRRGEDNKGTISVYGINKLYPISLYAEQWERLIKALPEIQAACKAPGVARRTK